MSKAEKYIDLFDEVFENTNVVERGDLHETLEWLDASPEQVPGRTITESEFQKLMEDVTTSYQVGFTDGLYKAGGRVVPDPGPTNAEKIEALLRAADEANADQEFSRFARYLDEHGVKAPEAGGDDEQ